MFRWLILSFMTLLSTSAFAYPDEPVKIVVSSQAGGGTDISARYLADVLSKYSKSPFIVINKPGASTAIASQFVMNSGDNKGYTILFGQQNIISSLTVQKNITFEDFNNKLRMVALITTTPQIIVAKTGKFKNINDLIEQGKIDKKLSFALVSLGGGAQLSSQMLTKGVPILYKGSSDAIYALLKGEVDFFSSSLADAIPFIKSGDLEILATLTPNRLPEYPNVPAYEVPFQNFTAVFLPKDVPDDVVEQLRKLIDQAKQDKDLIDNNLKIYQTNIPNLPIYELEKKLRQEYNNYNDFKP